MGGRALLVLGLVFVGCNRPEAPAQPRDPVFSGKDNPAPKAAKKKAPSGAFQAAPAADADPRPVDVTPAKAALGKEKYAVCAGCHGPEAEGRVGIAPRLASKTFLAAASDRMLSEVIAKGRTGTTMVPWGGVLKPDEIDAIIAWLRTKVKTDPVKLDESPSAGDVKVGLDVYKRVCSTCHGRSGAGYQESGSGTGIGRKAFLASATNGFLRYVIKHGKSNTMMRPFAAKAPTAVANLSKDEIEGVIAYLRNNAW